MSALRPEGIAGITMRHAIAATLMYGKGRAIALLALTWDVESLDSKPFVELRRALDEDRGKLNDWFPQLGADFHHVLLLAEDQVGELEALARAASPGEDSDRPFRELCQRYVSAASKDNRSQYLTAVFPSEPNRYQGSVAAVTPGASLLGGQESHIRLSMVLAAAQALADVAALRAIHAVAHAALGRLPTEEGKGRALRDLEYSAQVLRDLELDLGFNVEAQLSIRIRVPILPVEQFYACLLEALGVERSVDMTSAMLARLGKVLDARQAAAAARTARLERAFGTALSAAGGLAIPITIGLAFVGANVSEVRTKTSIFSGHYLIYYLGLGASPVLLGILVWIGVWFRSRSPKRGTADIPTSAY
jgi:hypothetical protein